MFKKVLLSVLICNTFMGVACDLFKDSFDGQTFISDCIPASNIAPVISNNEGSVSIKENTTVVGDYHAKDDDGDSITYSLTGTDATLFAINNSGVLSFINAPDFEVPTDGDSNNVYEVSISASDGELTASQVVTVTVTDEDEGSSTSNTAPVISNNEGSVSIEENTTAVGDYHATDVDGDSLTYSLTGTDASLFSINNSGVLSFTNAPDFEAPKDGDSNNVYEVSVSASDGELTASQAVTITVINVVEPGETPPSNTPPVFSNTTASVNVKENIAEVGDYSATDNDGDAITYSLTGTDATLFAINNSGVLSFKNAPDFEAPKDGDSNNVYEVSVLASDGELTASQEVTVTVTDEDEGTQTPNNPPVINSNAEENVSIYENTTAVGDYHATDDDDDNITYSLTGTDAKFFDVDSNGVVSFKEAPDYEVPKDNDHRNTYAFTLVASDGKGGEARQSILVNVKDVFIEGNITPTLTGKLNDTGIQWLGLYPNGRNTDCFSDDVQDCSHGRDAKALAGTLTKKGRGNAGFDFTKLDANGGELDGTASEWSCVRDNVTGLVWEVKTTDNGLHDKAHKYTWYESDDKINGGSEGYSNDYGDECSGSKCNTLAFAKAVQSEALCGKTDWRLPTIEELHSIVDLSNFDPDYSEPRIDLDYFPNVAVDDNDYFQEYWSSSTLAKEVEHAWLLGFGEGNVSRSGGNGKANPAPARLVSGVAETLEQDFPVSQANCLTNILADTPNSRFDVKDDGTVEDKVTGLVWMRCSLGQSGSDCAGEVASYNWQEAFTKTAEINVTGFAGKTDWRLPNIKELSSIIERRCFDPSINISIFPKTKHDKAYWSSSPFEYPYDPSRAKAVYFSIGYDSDMSRNSSTKSYVRLVRAGKE